MEIGEELDFSQIGLSVVFDKTEKATIQWVALENA
jgi:hypothetical protein